MLLSLYLFPAPTMGLEAVKFQGLTLDPDRSGQAVGRCLISGDNSAVEIRVNRANQKWTIARDTYRLASGDKPA